MNTEIMLGERVLVDGDVVAQLCPMIDDYTGKTSVGENRLLIQWNPERNDWDVKCLDAVVGYKNNFWGYLPKFTVASDYKFIGNVNLDKSLLPFEVGYKSKPLKP